VNISGDWWQIFDGNGTPLGVVKLPEDESIEEYDVANNLIPFADIQPTTEVSRDNPKTGDSVYTVFGLLLLIAAGAGVVVVKKKKFVK